MNVKTELLPKVMEAAVFAAVKHQYLRRGGYDQLPYINHLLKITNELITIGGERDEALLIAAILHDVLEDTDTNFQELSNLFGQEVASIVNELTDDMSLPHKVRKELQVTTATKLSRKAQIIRLADKASNIRDIFTYPLNWPLEKKIAYVDNAEAVANEISGENPKIDAWLRETILWARGIIKNS